MEKFQKNLEVYKAWAPPDAMWSEFVKPAIFAKINPYGHWISQLNMSSLEWADQLGRSTMVIVDLLGATGVTEGLALAQQKGLRPIPLYNCVKDVQLMLVDAEAIENELCLGVKYLESLNIRHDAMPAFLLDSQRMEASGKQKGRFDNRWCLFPQDMPSADYLIKNGVTSVVVRSDKIRNDLAHVLRRYLEKKIRIFLCDGSVEIVEQTVVRPSKFQSLSYRFKVTFGLVRNPAGGFGGYIPEPMDSYSDAHSGAVYYRYG